MKDINDPEVIEESKTCPMCGKSIRVAARICRFCGEPQYDMAGGDGAWRDGTLLVMRKNAELPYRCIKSNEPAAGWLSRTLYWHHPALYLLLLLGPAYLIAMPFFQHSVRFRMALSQQYSHHRFCRLMTSWTMVLGAVALSITAATGLTALSPVLVVVGACGVLPAILFAADVYEPLTPAKMSRNFVWLNGVHRDYLATLPEWPGESDELLAKSVI